MATITQYQHICEQLEQSIPVRTYKEEYVLRAIIVLTVIDFANRGILFSKRVVPTRSFFSKADEIIKTYNLSCEESSLFNAFAEMGNEPYWENYHSSQYVTRKNYDTYWLLSKNFKYGVLSQDFFDCLKDEHFIVRLHDIIHRKINYLINDIETNSENNPEDSIVIPERLQSVIKANGFYTINVAALARNIGIKIESDVFTNLCKVRTALDSIGFRMFPAFNLKRRITVTPRDLIVIYPGPKTFYAERTQIRKYAAAINALAYLANASFDYTEKTFLINAVKSIVIEEDARGYYTAKCLHGAYSGLNNEEIVKIESERLDEQEKKTLLVFLRELYMRNMRDRNKVFNELVHELELYDKDTLEEIYENNRIAQIKKEKNTKIKEVSKAKEKKPVISKKVEIQAKSVCDKIDINHLTTLKELCIAEVISVRVFNVLNYLGINTVSDLLDRIAEGIEFDKYPRWGRKCNEELQALLKEVKPISTTTAPTVDPYHNACCGVYDRMLTSLKDDDVKSFIVNKFENADCFLQELNKNSERLFELQESLSRTQNIEYRNFIIGFLQASLELSGFESSSMHNLFEFLSKKFASRVNSFTLSEKYEYFFDEEKKRLLELELQDIIKKRASVRTSNIIKETKTNCNDFIVFTEKGAGYISERLRVNVHSRTVLESSLIAEQLESVAETIAVMTPLEAERLYIIKKYDLSEDNDEDKFVVDYISNNKQVPYFLLAKIRLLRLQDIRAIAIRGYYGIGTRKKTKEEIAYENGYTRERIRQLIESYHKLTLFDIEESAIIEQYPELNKKIFYEESSEVLAIIEKESLNMTAEQFFVLFLCARKNFWCMRLFECPYLIEKGFYKILKLNDFYENISEIVKRKYTEDTSINVIEELDMSNLLYSYSDNLKTLVNFIAWANNAVVDENGDVIFSRNYVDVGKELHKILVKENREMNLVELFRKFKERFPKHKITSPNQLSTYIIRSKNIKSIGKRGLYVAENYTGLYFEHTVDVIIYLLEQSPVPLNSEVISKEVRKLFPGAVERRVLEILRNDEENRFCRFKGYFFGLSGKKYPSEFEPEHLHKITRRWRTKDTATKKNIQEQSAKNIEDLLDFDF